MDISYSNGERLLVLSFDGTVRELHSSQLVVTEHPVEKGANVSDHVRKQLAHLVCEAMITNHPIKMPTSGMGGVGGGVSGRDLQWNAREETRQQRSITFPSRFDLPVGVPILGAVAQGTGLLDTTETVTVQTRAETDAADGATAQVLQFDGPFDRVRNVYEELLGFQDNATLLTIHTTIREYENMILQNLTAPREVKDGKAITFSFDLKEIRFVTSQTVKAPLDKKKTPSKANLGAKSTEKTDNRTFTKRLAIGAEDRFNIKIPGLKR